MRLLCPCTSRLGLIRLSLEFRMLVPSMFHPYWVYLHSLFLEGITHNQPDPLHNHNFWAVTTSNIINQTETFERHKILLEKSVTFALWLTTLVQFDWQNNNVDRSAVNDVQLTWHFTSTNTWHFEQSTVMNRSIVATLPLVARWLTGRASD